MNVYKVNHARLLGLSGVVLFVISLLNGFMIHSLTLPRLALSAHLVGLMGSLFLMVLASTWSKFKLNVKTSKIGSLLALYGFIMGWLLYFLAAWIGAGESFPLASGDIKQSQTIEQIIKLLMLTVAIALFTLSVILWKGYKKMQVDVNE